MKYPVNFEIELKRNTNSGLYIALEGIDGSGKTTQAEALKNYFEGKGRKVFSTHEPRLDGILGPIIHDVLNAKKKIPPIANQYLFAAQRVVHLEEMVIPALKRGEVVVSDRSFWSSIPYGLFDRDTTQGQSNDQLLSALSLLSLYHQFITPDFTFLLDISVETAGERINALKRKASIYEKAEKLRKIKAGYDYILEKFPKELLAIEADNSIQNITQDITAHIEKDGLSS